MKRLLTYLFALVVMTTLSGLDSVVMGEQFSSLKTESKESEEKEECTEEDNEIQAHQAQRQKLKLTPTYSFEYKVATNVSESTFADVFILSAYYKLNILYETFLI